MLLFLPTARELPQCADPGCRSEYAPIGLPVSSPAVSALVCADLETGTDYGVKTGGIAAFLNRRQQFTWDFTAPGHRRQTSAAVNMPLAWLAKAVRLSERIASRQEAKGGPQAARKVVAEYFRRNDGCIVKTSAHQPSSLGFIGRDLALSSTARRPPVHIH